MIEKKSKKADLSKKTGLYMTIGLVVSLLLVITAFEWRFYDDGALADLGHVTDDFVEMLDIPQTEQPPPPPPKIQQPEIIEVPDEEIIEEIEVDLDVEITEDKVIEEIIFEEPIEEEDADQIFLIVEEEAEPVGGYRAFYKFVYDHLKYSTQARRMGIEGRVTVQFVVEKDGSLSEIIIMKGIGAGCNVETIRVIASSPKWKPAKQRGNPVRVRRALPINFKLQ